MEVNTHTMMFLYILVAVVQGQQVDISVQSAGYPGHLYRDEPIAITCTASGYTTAETVRLVNGNTNTDPYYGCVYSVGSWITGGPLSTFPWLTAMDNEDCKAGATNGAQSPPYNLSLKGQVSDDMVGLNLNCLAYLDGSTVLSTDSLTISEIRVVPPGSPTLTISGYEPKIAEGNPFTFSCSPSTASPGAQPTSEYSYEVLRYDGMTVASTSTYTPVEADRGGIKLRCTDTVHYDALKDKNPDQVVKETDLLKPWYLINNGEENIATQLNPSAEYPLTCDVSGYPEDNIAYSWICDGCTSTDTASVLVVPNRPRTSGQTETISCTANLPPLAPVTITWTVIWSSDATLPTEGPDSTTVPASKTTPNAPAIALGVIAGLLTIALLVVSLLFWNYRRNVGNNGGVVSSNRREQHEHALNQMELNASQRGKRVGVTSGDRGDNYTSLDTSRREEHAYAAVGDGDMQGYEVMDLGQPARVILA